MLRQDKDRSTSSYLEIERIKTGFIIKNGDGEKIFKSTANGLLEYIKNYWCLKVISDPKRKVLKEKKSENNNSKVSDSGVA